ncbi:MAG: hypothetical protein WC358_02065 [Ignavibacteria bacterium]|jgi:hypothetical protein
MEKPEKIKILIIISLVIFAVILIFLKVTSVKEEKEITQRKEEKTEVRQLSQEELKKIIPREIDSILFQYGVKHDWIKNISNTPPPEKLNKEKTKKQDKPSKPVTKQPIQTENLWFVKEITIPKDIPFAEINLEIVSLLNSYNLSAASFEDPKTYNQLFNIYYTPDSSKKVIAKINFIYSDKVKRETADICIVLDNIDSYTHTQLEKLLVTSEKYSVMLPDDINKIDLQTMVMESKKDYLVKAEIGLQDDIAAEFRNDMKEKDWRTKVRTLCYEFDKAAGIVLKNPKMLHKMEMELLDEFSKYPVKAYRDTLFTKYNSTENSIKKISDLFNLILNRAKNGITSQIYIVNFTDEDFQNYLSGLYVIKKRGYKFFTFSDIMKRRAKLEMKEEAQ